MPEPLHPETVAVSAGRPDRPGDPMNPPVVLASSFRSDDGFNAYARGESHDTVRAFEAAVGALEGGTAVAFSSGMAAVHAVVDALPAGSAVVLPTQPYGGTFALFGEQARLGRLTVRPVDLTDTSAVIEQVEGADLVWLETVTNPMLGVADLPAIIAAARAENATVVVDATFTTPLGVHPLVLGADIVLHSATKFISGHSDLLMGVLVTDDATAEQLRSRRALTGAFPGALESYLALRGLRTLPLRFERAQANAMVLAERLAAHAAVSRVRYPGLAADPGHEVARRDHPGFGSMVSFEVHGGAAAADRVCDAAKLIVNATSLGGVESSMERRSHHEIDARTGVPDSLIRLSVGIEHVEDLWADLEQALAVVE